MLGLVVLNYNDWERTREFVILVSSFEMIDVIAIVDNASTDESEEELKSMESCNVRYLQSENNRGYSSGNNLGLKYLCEEVKCDYVIVANPDTIPNLKLIEESVKMLDTHREIAIVSGVPRTPLGTIQKKPYWDIPSYAHELRSLLFLGRRINERLKPHLELIHKRAAYVDVVAGSFFLARAEAIMQIAYFDEGTFLYCEESILSIRLKQLGYRVAVLLDESYIHVHGGTTSKAFRLYQSQSQLHKSQLYYLRNYQGVGAMRSALFKLCSYVSNVEFLVFEQLVSMKRKSNS